MKFLIFFIFVSQASIYKKGMGVNIFGRHLGSTLNLDFQKSYISVYMDFKKRRPMRRSLKRQRSFKKELKFYSLLFKKTLTPKFFLIEADVYPLTSLGVSIKKNSPSDYESFRFSHDDIRGNFMEIATTKSEVPYSLSVFLGEIFPFYAKFKRKGKIRTRQSGSAVMGHVFTVGDRRLIKLDNHVNKWFQYSYKIKGTDVTKWTKKRWTFEIGHISHQNNQFFDGIIVNVVRDWASRKDPSWFANFKLEYSFSIPTNFRGRTGIEKYTTFQKIILGRNYHYKSLIIGLDIGTRWEVFKEGLGTFSETSIILAPNLSW